MRHRAGERVLCRSSEGKWLEPRVQLQQLPQEHIYGPVHKLLYGPIHKQSDGLKGEL